MMMKIKKIVATTHEARLVRPEGGRGLFGLVVVVVVVVVGMMGPSAMASGGGSYVGFVETKLKCECESGMHIT